MLYLIIIFTYVIIAKVVIVDDIGLTKEELEKLKGLNNRDIISMKDALKEDEPIKPNNFHSPEIDNGNSQPIDNRNKPDGNTSENKPRKIPKKPENNIMTFPRDFINQRNDIPPSNNQQNKSSSEDYPSFYSSLMSPESKSYAPKNNNINEPPKYEDRTPPNQNYNATPNYKITYPSKNEDSWLPSIPDYHNPDMYPLIKDTSSYQNIPSYPTLEEEAKNLERKEKENLNDANRARTQYIDLKLHESKQRYDKIQNALFEVQSQLSTIDSKLRERKNEYENIIQQQIILKNRKHNLVTNQRKYEIERDKSEASLRLINNEIAHLYKQLDDLKSKALTTKEERNVYVSRLENHDKLSHEVSKGLNEAEAKITEYQKELNSLEVLFTKLKNQIGDLDSKKSRESALQNQLEMERERIARNDNVYT